LAVVAFFLGWRVFGVEEPSVACAREARPFVGAFFEPLVGSVTEVDPTELVEASVGAVGLSEAAGDEIEVSVEEAWSFIGTVSHSSTTCCFPLG
jgi:hypothetical protein